VGPALGRGELTPELVQIPIVQKPAIGLHMITRAADRGRVELGALMHIIRGIAITRRASEPQDRG
jgi:hypothetical protein